MLDRVKHSFFWPTQSKDVHKYCAGCAMCAARKGQGRCICPYLKNIPSPTNPMELVSIDVLSLKTTTKGNQKVLMAVDLLTKFLFLALTQDEKTETLSAAYRGMFQYTGFPKVLLSDNGPNFRSQQFEDLNKGLGVKRNYTTTWHPMGNSPVERVNCTIVQRLATAIVESHLDWDEIVPSLLLAYNTTFHNSIGNTPYDLMYGRKCNLPIDSPLAMVVPLTMADNGADQALYLKAGWEVARKIMAVVQEKNKQQYD